MATSKATLDFKKFTENIKKELKKATSPSVMRALSEFALNLIVKRSRLGFGVSKNFGEKSKFPNLSDDYIKQRRRFKGLSFTTSPSKSNITRTGQLLLSMQVTVVKQGSFTIAPTGQRTDSRLSNKDLAEILAKKNRVFNRLSQLEYNQLVRFYRRTFGDLLKKRNLLR